jgi:hypothetical protein
VEAHTHLKKEKQYSSKKKKLPKKKLKQKTAVLWQEGARGDMHTQQNPTETKIKLVCKNWCARWARKLKGNEQACLSH